jgi:hypothetical protein
LKSFGRIVRDPIVENKDVDVHQICPGAGPALLRSAPIFDATVDSAVAPQCGVHK